MKTNNFNTEGCTLVCGAFQNALVDMPKVDLIITSPPYNIGSKCERRDGKRRKGEYDPKSFGAVRSYPDNLPEDEYQRQQTDAMSWMASKLNTHGSLVYNHKPRHRERRLIKPESWFSDDLVLTDEIVWDRFSTHNHCKSFVYQQTERIYVLSPTGYQRKQYFKNEGHGDVWRIPRARVVGSNHDASYPLELARRCVRLWSRPGDTVCDPYSGSGTTMIAAYLEGRKFIGAELMPVHFNESIKRFEKYLREYRVAV
jgi:DNA modification methylase